MYHRVEKSRWLRSHDAGLRTRQRYGLGVGVLVALLVATLNDSMPASARTLGMVTNEYHNSVTVFDADSDAVVGSVAVGPGDIQDCAVNEAQTRGYVSDYRSNVWVIDLIPRVPILASGTNPIPISNLGEDTSLTADGRFLLVCSPQPNFISVVDTVSQSEVSTFNLGGSCLGIEACSDGSVLALGFNHVYRLMIDASGTLTDTGEVLSQTGVVNVFCAPDAKSGIAVSDALLQIESFRIPGLTPGDTRDLAGSGISGVMNPAGDRAFIRTSSTGTVAIFGYTSTSVALSAAPLFLISPIAGAFSGFGMDQMALHPNGSKLYVPINSAASSNRVDAVQVYDPTTGILLSSITHPSLTQPTGICLPAYPRLCNNDGIIDLSEQCDDGNADDNDACKNDCTLNVCGDGVLNVGVEECDDGNTSSADACKDDCTPNVCGDGALNVGVEQCDDGNLVDGDGCDSNCTPTGCGNGIVTAGELCDDGNLIDGDGCDSNCTPTGCGNGAVGPGEECDDGNMIDGDGCTSTCTVETGFSCSGAPSVCELPPDPLHCDVEWFVRNPHAPLNRLGFAKREMCTDGDPSCDFRPNEAGVCEYQVKVCLNNKDRRLPRCIPNGISSVEVIGPKLERIHDAGLRATVAADLAAVQNGLVHLLDPQNPAAGFANAPPLIAMQQGFCSAPFPIDVPLLGARRKSVTIKTRSADSRVPKPRVLISKLKLTCDAR